MVCKNCGTEIPEGALYCESCGAPLEEPVVLKVSKEDIKRAEKEEKTKAKERAKAAALAARKEPSKPEPKQIHKKPADPNKKIDIVGYVKSIGTDLNTMLSFIGAIILYLAPFMNWIYEKVFDVKRKASLFEMGMKSSMVEEDGSILAMGATILMILGIVAILVGIWMLLLSGADYIAPLRRFAGNPIMRFAPVVVMILIFVLIMKNRDYVQSLRVLENNVRLSKDLGSSSNYGAGRGVGPLLYICGLVIYTLGTIGDFLAHRQREE